MKTIESLLVESRAKPGQGGETALPNVSVPLASSHLSPGTVFDQDDAPVATEGSSSLQAHADMAQTFVRGVVDLKEACAHILSVDLNTDSAPLQWPSRTRQNPSQLASPEIQLSSSYRRMPLPPTCAIVDILRRFKGELASTL